MVWIGIEERARENRINKEEVIETNKEASAVQKECNMETLSFLALVQQWCLLVSIRRETR